MNRKSERLILILLSAVMLLTTAGCSTQEQESDSVAVTPEQTITQDTPNATTPALECDYAQVYDEILQSACALLLDVDNHEAVDGEMGIWETAVGMESAEALDCVGYSIQDISGDDIPELLIGYIAKDSSELRNKNIFAVYTCVDSSPSLVFEGWYRNAYYYLGDGRFFNTGSASAMCSIFGTYGISLNGKELICEDYYFTFEKEGGNSEIGFYHNQTGLTDPDSSEKLDITDHAFWSMEEEFALQIKSLALIPFSDYATAQGYESTAEATVHVQWAEDAELLTDYDEYNVSESSEPQARIVFTTDIPVESFTILELTLVDVSENGNMEFEAYPVTPRIFDLRPDRPLVIGLTFAGDIPCYGFQYDDANGNCRRFALEISGEDGSILMREADREYVRFVLSGSTD